MSEQDLNSINNSNPNFINNKLNKDSVDLM